MDEIMKELTEAKEYLGISDKDFLTLIEEANNYRENSKVNISDEKFVEIVKEALLNVDNLSQVRGKENDFVDKISSKTTKEAFDEAIRRLGI